MKRFLVKTIGFVAAVLLMVYLLFINANGHTDEYYLKLTTPKQENLILGASRALVSLQPAVFEESLGEKIYNYAFTIGHSPFGPTYLQSIKKKLRKEGTNRTFIVSVNPWVIASRSEDPNDSTNFRELALCLANTSEVDKDPNFEYLLKNLRGSYYKLLPINFSQTFLHTNGWLEVMSSNERQVVEGRIGHVLKTYTHEKLVKDKFSSLRLNYLIETIDYLQQFGDVYLVRLPIDPRLMEIENEFMPAFDETIHEAIELATGYLDLTPYNSEYLYSDGSHLQNESGEAVSRRIAEWILTRR